MGQSRPRLPTSSALAFCPCTRIAKGDFMRRFLLAVPVIFFLSSCSQTTGGGQRATVELRDGTSVSGTVVSSSGSEIQIAADDQTKRTIPMAQVRSVEYEEPAPAAPPASPAPSAA